ncbi:MAG: DUF493 domain-containing protein [Gemmatimonadetes bacterium]|nr:MAG: DUF493 domain-containing protein [Gemmatimonadota bacterium]
MSHTTELQFPVDWHYKIITLRNSSAKIEIDHILKQHGVDTVAKPGNISRNGKYQTYQVTVTFYDLESMRTLSAALAEAECVKFLL